MFDQDKKRNCVEVEYPVVGMPNQTGRGYVDYVIWGDTGKIIAVVEAKRQARAEIKAESREIICRLYPKYAGKKTDYILYKWF